MRLLLLITVAKRLVEHISNPLANQQVLVREHMCQWDNQLTVITNDSREVKAII